MARLRYQKDAINKLMVSSYYQSQPLKNVSEIHLEVGTGKGNFLITKALKDPKNFFVGIEKYPTVLLKALNKLNCYEKPLMNLKIICDDASRLSQWFDHHTISHLYLNFSDPWPKKRHAKRRLTSDLFLNIYKPLMSKNHYIEFKTDDVSLYQFTLETLKQRHDVLIYYETSDLYNDLDNCWNKDNVASEYEMKFFEIKRIHKITFAFI